MKVRVFFALPLARCSTVAGRMANFHKNFSLRIPLPQKMMKYDDDDEDDETRR
jgi:hypothetical protein